MKHKDLTPIPKATFFAKTALNHSEFVYFLLSLSSMVLTTTLGGEHS